MNGQLVSAVVLALGVAVVAIVIAIYLLNWLYRRSTKEVSFVRTGLGGQRVVINGGALVLPIVHEVTLVNMTVLRMGVICLNEKALITRDRMRVNLEADFYVRVAPDADAVAAAAQTLGGRTMEQERLHELLQGKFVGALRSVAAATSMEEMHERRVDYVQLVKKAAAEALAQNGLELESVAITGLDQTDLSFFNPSNRFDADGLTHLIQEIEKKRKVRNDIEQETALEIRARNLESERRTLEIERQSEVARLEQEQELESRRAAQRAQVKRERAQREAESSQAEIAAHELLETTRIQHERTLAEARIASELGTQQREIERRQALEAAEIAAREGTERRRLAQERALTEDRLATEEHAQMREIATRELLEKARIEQEAGLAIERVRAEQQVQLERVRCGQATRIIEIGRDKAIENEELAAREAIEAARINREAELSVLRIDSDLQLDFRRITALGNRSKHEIEQRKDVSMAEHDREIALSKKRAERVKDDATNQRTEITARTEVEQARSENELKLSEIQAAKRCAIEQAEIAAFEAVDKARITAEHGLDIARIHREREVRKTEIARDLELQLAEVDKSIELHTRSKDESDAQLAATEVVARAAEAGERVVSARETEAARRRASIDILLAQAQAQVVTAGAEGERVRREVEAHAQRLANEAENVLTDEARQTLVRRLLLEKLEGIVRESVRPMEKIEGIRIVHLDGMQGGGGPREHRSPTDEVMESALRYRVQAPMIDSLMKDIGIEGGSVTKMTDLLRDGRDMANIARDRAVAGKASGIDKN